MIVNLFCAVVHPQVLACKLPSERRDHTAQQGLPQAGEQASHRFPYESYLQVSLMQQALCLPHKHHLPKAEAAPILPLSVVSHHSPLSGSSSSNFHVFYHFFIGH